MGDRHHDIFGRLLVDPAYLTRTERVNELRKLAAALQCGKPDKRAARWLGKALQDWLQDGGDLFDLLGVRPPPGSNLTPQRQVAQEAQDRALLRLAVTCGTDRAALDVLRGKTPCPPKALELLQALEGAPKSARAISRARKRVSHPNQGGDHV